MGRARALNLLALCILVLFGAVGMNAQCAPDPVTHQLPAICVTVGQLNGHWWNSMPDTIKTGFVLGYGAHAQVGGEAACGPAPKDFSEKAKAEWNTWDNCRAEWSAANILAGELVSRLDALYTQAENLGIGIHEAIHIIGMSVLGKPASEIEKRLSDDRKWAAMFHAKKERGTATVDDIQSTRPKEQ